MGVVVNYNTPVLLKNAIDSIRKYYDFPIIVISDAPYLERDDVILVETGYNIGHGPGMDMGIRIASSKYVLTFDTDIIMNRPCIELMLDKLGDNYSIGKVYEIPLLSFYEDNRDIFDFTENPVMTHPSFQIVNREEYFKYAPYISDGAPTVLAYHDIMRKGDKHKIIDFPVQDYVWHRDRGTRDITDVYDYTGNEHWKYKWKKYLEEPHEIQL